MSAKVPFVGRVFDCDPQDCFLDVVYHDIFLMHIHVINATSYKL